MTVSAQDWLDDFAVAAGHGDDAAVAALFHADGFWRDYLPFGWTLQTIEGADAIEVFASRTGRAAAFD